MSITVPISSLKPVNGGTPSGLVALFGLLDLQTATGARYFWSDHKAAWPCALDGSAQTYQAWLTGQAKFQSYGSTQTDTGSVSAQNVSGNTMQRDVALAFSRSEFIGALAVYRLWDGAAEQSRFTFIGNVADAEIDEQQLDLTLEGFKNWSAVTAPAFNIDVSCGLSFGSMQCGSTAATPCNQSYGSCTSIERFQGVIIQWDQLGAGPTNSQVVQPAPVNARNPARPF